MHFDPISGFRYTQVPSRLTRISHGEIEYVTSFRGNAQGFSDRDDFQPRRGSDRALRLAVLGDSFTAAEHLTVNWPDQIEAMTAAGSRPLRLYNFSVAGAGLANWWSIVIRLLAAEDYQLDGLVFAVFEGDLHRGFSFTDHRDSDRHRFARAASWRPQTWPTTLDQARPLLRTLPGYIVSPERFEQALAGRWHPLLPRPPGFYASARLAKLFSAGPPRPVATPPPDFVPGQLALIDDLARYAGARELPVLVVSLPSLEALLAARPAPADARAFARRLQARFVDGAEAFDGLDQAALRAAWMPYDGHWAAAGSARFAVFVEQLLRDWPAAR